MTALAAPGFRPLPLLALRMLEALHARILRREAIREIDRLSDSTLADVGLSRHDIAARVDAGMSRIGRLGLGR